MLLAHGDYDGRGVRCWWTGVDGGAGGRVLKCGAGGRVLKGIDGCVLLAHGDYYGRGVRCWWRGIDGGCADQVLDLCPGGDLFDFLSFRGSVSEDEARALFLQV